MKNKAKNIILSSLYPALIACGHSATKNTTVGPHVTGVNSINPLVKELNVSEIESKIDSQSNPSAGPRNPAGRPGGESPYDIMLSPKIFDQPLEVYLSKSFDPKEEQNLVLYFGPSRYGPSGDAKMAKYLKGDSPAPAFHGIFVRFLDDDDGEQAIKFLARAGAFDAFYQELLNQLSTVDSRIKTKLLNLVLIGHSAGADAIDRIFSFPSKVMKEKVAAAGFFDSQFKDKNSGAGIRSLLSESRIGFKSYALATKGNAQANRVVASADASSDPDARIDLEGVIESLTDDHFIKHEEAMSLCLPQFLNNLNVHPFIMFRCQRELEQSALSHSIPRAPSSDPQTSH